MLDKKSHSDVVSPTGKRLVERHDLQALLASAAMLHCLRLLAADRLAVGCAGDVTPKTAAVRKSYRAT